MGSYWDHKAAANYGFLIAILLLAAVIFHFTREKYLIRWILVTIIILPSVVIGYPAIRLGAMFPDVDSPSSIPYRNAMKALPVVGFLFGAVAYIEDGEAMQEAPSGLLITGVLGAVFFGLCRYFYKNGVLGRRIRPKHRGRTHERDTAFLVSKWIYRGAVYILRGLSFGSVGLFIATVFTGWFYIGYLSHLIRDQWGAKRRRPR